MKVKIHTLFEFLLETTAAEPPEAVLGFSLSSSPKLGDFLADLDPEMSLDWSNESFQGMDALRKHVIGRSNLAGVCTPDDVLITAGAAEANFLAITNLIQAGDELIVESPGWPQAAVLAEGIGAKMKTIYRREENQWQLDLDELADLISERTKLIFLTNPNNPTGRIMREPELLKIAELADTVGAYLLVDEVYAGLEWTGERVPSVAGLYERGITTSSVSKALGLQGLRTGWMICRDSQVIFDGVVLRENSSEIMNVMGEKIAEIALRPERYAQAIAKAKDEGRTNLALLDAFIDERPELSWHRPQAGLIGLCRLKLNMEMRSDAFARRLLTAPYKTFLIPGTAYGCPQHIRLGVGGGKGVRLEKGLGRLAACLDGLVA